MDYILFFKDNKRFITFGIMMTFFSSFGQTFLISLYVPNLIAMLGLTNAAFGGLYAGATILGAVSLMYFGRLIDTVSLRKFSVITAVILLMSCLVIAFSGSIAGVVIGLFGLRFAGQGLLGHIALTSMSRHYEENRGKALSLSVLGFSIGEAIFPVTIGFVIGLYDWRAALIFSAILIGIILIPLIYWLLSKVPDTTDNNEDKREKHNFSYVQLLSDKRFYIIALNGTMLPFMLTGLLFYQIILAEQKGWAIEWMATCFIGFAVARTLGSIVSGPLVDRYSGVQLFPLYLIPFVIGVSLLAFFSHPYIALFYLSLAGFAMGLSQSVKGAVLAEMYGTRYIGTIRSLFTALGVLSTAVSPVIIGWMLDAGWNFTSISLIAAMIVTGVIMLSFLLKTEKDYIIIPSQQ